MRKLILVLTPLLAALGFAVQSTGAGSYREITHEDQREMATAAAKQDSLLRASWTANCQSKKDKFVECGTTVDLTNGQKRKLLYVYNFNNGSIGIAEDTYRRDGIFSYALASGFTKTMLIKDADTNIQAKADTIAKKFGYTYPEMEP